MDCAVPLELIANGFCNDEANNAECLYDGGDCCGGLIIGTSCKYFVIDKSQMPRENNSSIPKPSGKLSQ